jgi:hypothetical protein
MSDLKTSQFGTITAIQANVAGVEGYIPYVDPSQTDPDLRNKRMTRSEAKKFFGLDVFTALSGTAWDGTNKTLTLTSNTALTFSSTKRNGILRVKQDGTGGRTLSINAISVPVASDANAITAISFFYDDVAATYIFSYDTNILGNVGGGGGGGGLPQLNTPGSFTATPGAPGAIVLAWTDTNSSPNETGYKVYWNAINDLGSAAVATTTAPNATGYTKTGLGSGTWYFWVIAVGDGTTATDSNSAAASSTAGAASVENLTLNSIGGVYTNSSQIFTVTAGGSSWHNDEKDAKHIAAGQDGYVQAQFATSDSLNCFLGFSTTNAATDYDTNMNAALWILTGGVVGYRDHGGTGGDVLETNSGTTLSANQWVRVSRTSGVLKLQKVDTDGTTVLSDIYTFSFTSTGILYIVSDMNGAGKLSNPKGYNITT